MGDLSFGLNLTLVGMSLVFGLLALLWGLLVLIGRLDRLQAERQAPDAEDTACLPSGLDPSLLAAITAALSVHLESRRRQGAAHSRATAPGSQLFASRWLAAGRSRQNRPWLRKG